MLKKSRILLSQKLFFCHKNSSIEKFIFEVEFLGFVNPRRLLFSWSNDYFAENKNLFSRPHTCTLLVEMMDSSESEYGGLVANMLKAIFSG